MHGRKLFPKIINVFLSVAFLWSNCAMAVDFGVYKLAARTQVDRISALGDFTLMSKVVSGQELIAKLRITEIADVFNDYVRTRLKDEGLRCLPSPDGSCVYIVVDDVLVQIRKKKGPIPQDDLSVVLQYGMRTDGQEGCHLQWGAINDANRELLDRAFRSTGQAGVSSTGRVTPEDHSAVNALIENNQKFLAHRGEEGSRILESMKNAPELLTRAVDRAIEGTYNLKVELPRELGRVDVYDALKKVNVVWVQAGPRAPPFEAHAGQARNTIYLIGESPSGRFQFEIFQGGIYHLQVIHALIEEAIELAIRTRTNSPWTQALAEEAHSFAHSVAPKYIPYGQLMEERCNEELGGLGVLKDKMDRGDRRKVEHYVNGVNASELLNVMDALVPSSPVIYEDKVEEDKTCGDAIDALVGGEAALVIYAAGEASRMSESLVEAGIVIADGFITQKQVEDMGLAAKFHWGEFSDKLVANNWGTRETNRDGVSGVRMCVNLGMVSAEMNSAFGEKYDDVLKILTTCGDQIEIKKPEWRIWNLRPWDLVRAWNVRGNRKSRNLRNMPQSLSIKRTREFNIGVRHIRSYLEGLHKSLTALGRQGDEQRIVKNLKIAITVNNEVRPFVEKDLIDNAFFGLNPENVILVLNDFNNGYTFDSNGRLVRSDEHRHKTNYNHGFNLINGSIPGYSYRFDAGTGKFELMEDEAGFVYLKNKGVKTLNVRRLNDAIYMSAAEAVDLGMLNIWERMRDESSDRKTGRGLACLYEVMNNPGNQKGGLSFENQHGDGDILYEGTATKVDSIQEKLGEINNAVRERRGLLGGVPYNRLSMYVDLAALIHALIRAGGLIPMSLKEKDGAVSPEIPTGDVTHLGMRARAIMRRIDRLVEGRVIIPDRTENIDPRRGARIWDFKSLPDLPVVAQIIDDLDDEWFAESHLTQTEYDELFDLSREIGIPVLDMLQNWNMAFDVLSFYGSTEQEKRALIKKFIERVHRIENTGNNLFQAVSWLKTEIDKVDSGKSFLMGKIKPAEGKYTELWQAELRDGKLEASQDLEGASAHPKFVNIDRQAVRDALNEILVEVAEQNGGNGIFDVIDIVRIVDNIDAAKGAGIMPYSKLIKTTDGRNILLLDVDPVYAYVTNRDPAIRNFINLELDHEFKHSVISILPNVPDYMDELTANYLSLKLALKKYEERKLDLNPFIDSLKGLGADDEFFTALQLLIARGISADDDNGIIAVAIEYMRIMPHYSGLFDEFDNDFKDEWKAVAQIRAAMKRYEAALRIFNGIEKAKGIADEVKKTAARIDTSGKDELFTRLLGSAI